MPAFTDQLNRVIEVPSAPKRIISVVPSQTELLFYLGLGSEVIGITKFCVHPSAQFKTTLKVGGTKQLDIELIKRLNPDLIIANKEENERSQIEELMRYYPVWISDISNLDDAQAMISGVGQLVCRELEAANLNQLITSGFAQLPSIKTKPKVAYFIWRKPYMVAGKNTFIDDMLNRCGLQNVFNTERYPEVNTDCLIATNPDVVLLSSEPYPFKQKHIDEFKAMLPRAKVLLVDGEMFSWYGSRLLKAPAYFGKMFSQSTG
ncbi:MAG: ABC transporter substrate-binding protein [Mucilaginibacter sp.]